MRKFILNSPILTEYGSYEFYECSISRAQGFIDEETVSAIGHQATADVLSEILGETIPCNRIQVKMQPGDAALVFRLKERLPEGKILSAEELKKLDYDLGLLYMYKDEDDENNDENDDNISQDDLEDQWKSQRDGERFDLRHEKS